jgi:4-hydroxy-3-polyprenylbenzoate decarboxylase
MQVTGPRTTYMRWLKHRGGAQHHARWKREKAEPLPAAAVIGADPGTILAAVTRFRTPCRNISSPAFCAAPRSSWFLQDGAAEGAGGSGDRARRARLPRRLRRRRAVRRSHRLLQRRRAVPGLHRQRHHHAPEPIYLSTFTGRPPDEPSVLGEALNEVFIPLFIQQFPEIVDFWLPPEGCSYRVAVVAMRKDYPGHAKRVMLAVWSYLRQFMYTKFVIVVDADMNARDWTDVIWAISTNVDAARDITVIENTPIDYLDFASPESGLGSKLGIDATTKIPPETKRPWGQRIRMTDEIIDLVSGKWERYGLPGSGKPIWK